MEEDLERMKTLFFLRLTIVACLLIAALSVLESLTELFFYWAYIAGKVSATEYPEFYKTLEEIAQSPSTFLLYSLYNIVVWNGVIISSIWLFRFHEWARKLLKGLLAFDIIFTVSQLLWYVYHKDLQIFEPVWFIGLNTVQVLAIIALSHPRIIAMTDKKSSHREDSVSSFFDSGES